MLHFWTHVSTRFLKNEIKVKALIIDELLAINRNNDEQNTSKDRTITSFPNNIKDAPSSLESSLHDVAHENIWKCFDERW